MNYLSKLRLIEEKIIKNQGSGIVGIFDSGVGGLTTFDIIKNSRDVIYTGDTAHFPYGEKSEDQIQRLVINRILDLLDRNAEHIGIACNTASIAFAKLKPNNFIKSKIIGTIECTSKYLSTTNAHIIGVIGTHYTVNSKAYSKNIKMYDKEDKVYILESAEQELVVNIEKGHDQKIKSEVERISKFFKLKNIDTFILGCTHYSHIKNYFETHLDNKVNIVDPSEILAKEILKNTKSSKIPSHQVLFTGNKPELSGLLTKYDALILKSKIYIKISNKVEIS